MNESLHSHGFLSLNGSLCSDTPLTTDVPRLGKRHIVQGEQWFFLNTSLSTYNGVPTMVGYTNGSIYDEGTYGKIYKAKRLVLAKREDRMYDVVDHPEEIVLKTAYPEATTFLTPIEIKSHISESLLHVLSWQAMQETATPWGVPRPYEIFGDGLGSTGDDWLSMTLCMSFVDGSILHKLFQRTWLPSTKRQNTQMFKEIIGQIAYILHTLQTKLHLNHRDLKVNNILVRSRPVIVLTIDDMHLTTDYEVTMIDFGFACVGCMETESKTLFQAGSWFPFYDVCYKKGRDIAQLLYCINSYFPLEEYLTPAMFQSVKAVLQVPWRSGVANCLEGFSREGIPEPGKPEYDTGIYEFLRRDEVDPVACEPLAIFKLMCS